MNKKLLILLVFLLLVMPTDALANDGGSMMDDDGFLTIIAKPLSKECTIGEEFEFKLTLTNNTKYPIEAIMIHKIFDGTDIYYLDQANYDWGDFNCKILAGEKVELNVKTTVQPNIKWYKKKNSFYADFLPKLLYFASYENDDKELLSWHFVHAELKPYPIKITNLNDGSDLINLNLNEKETTFYFPEHQEFKKYIYDGELYSTVYNELEIINVSNSSIENIYISNHLDLNGNHSPIKSIEPSKSYSIKTYNSHFIAPEELLEKLPCLTQLNFQSEGKFYGVELLKEYQAIFLKCPKLKLNLEESTDGGKSSISVENVSDQEYENIYIDFSHSYSFYENDSKPFYNDDQIIQILSKNSTISLDSQLTPNRDKDFFIGLIRDDKLYYWNVDSDSNPVLYRDGYNPLYYSITTLENYRSLQFPTPIPTSTAKPSQSPAIEITDVKKSSSIPLWVWIVLPLAVIGAAVLIIVFRRRKPDDSLKDE